MPGQPSTRPSRQRQRKGALAVLRLGDFPGVTRSNFATLTR